MVVEAPHDSCEVNCQPRCAGLALSQSKVTATAKSNTSKPPCPGLSDKMKMVFA